MEETKEWQIDLEKVSQLHNLCCECYELPLSITAPSSSSFLSIKEWMEGVHHAENYGGLCEAAKSQTLPDSAICVICFWSVREQKRTEAWSKVPALLRTYNQIHYFIFWTRMGANLTRQHKPSSHQQRKLIAFVISHQQRFHDYSCDEKHPAGAWGRVFKGWRLTKRLTWSEMTLWFHNVRGQQHIRDMPPPHFSTFSFFMSLFVFRSYRWCPFLVAVQVTAIVCSLKDKSKLLSRGLW